MGIISLSRLLLSVNKNNIFTINCIAFFVKIPLINYIFVSDAVIQTPVYLRPG